MSAWATGGNVSAATIQLQTSPTGAGTPVFTSGCGINGTSSCSLGAVDAAAAHRQLRAQFAVPTTAATVSSVNLTAIVSATNLPAAMETSGSMSISTSPAPGAANSSPLTATSSQQAANSSLLVANSSLTGLDALGVAAPTTSLSPGGSASGLFPTLNPSSSTSSSTAETATPVADTSSPTETASPTGAEVAGLAALAFAVVLAVTRLSIRRPAPPAAPAPEAKSAPSESPAAETPEESKGSDGPATASSDASEPGA